MDLALCHFLDHTEVMDLCTFLIINGNILECFPKHSRSINVLVFVLSTLSFR